MLYFVSLIQVFRVSVSFRVLVKVSLRIRVRFRVSV